MDNRGIAQGIPAQVMAEEGRHLTSNYADGPSIPSPIRRPGRE